MTSVEPAEPTPSSTWLLLLHRLPSKPAYLRVKVWRRLRALGAVAVKSAAYALPAGDQAREDLEWLLKEIVEDGGEGAICEARLIDGLSDEQVRNLFREAREAEYNTLASDVRALDEALAANGKSSPGGAQVRLTRVRANLDQIAARDFFGASGREAVEGLLGALQQRLRAKEANVINTRSCNEIERATLNGRVWVTRQGVYIDRIASAWLIRRFIDSDPLFKFVPAKGYVPAPGEIRFDMYDGEFTHEGDRCTFEVLLARRGLNDPALTVIGQIVHDIDLKD
ncbi:MAG: chromate resistance protein ChrB domain-containing protein, partial [Acetobacteraceae bacterium]